LLNTKTILQESKILLKEFKTLMIKAKILLINAKTTLQKAQIMSWVSQVLPLTAACRGSCGNESTIFQESRREVRRNIFKVR
jgi:hypothetical protein